MVLFFLPSSIHAPIYKNLINPVVNFLEFPDAIDFTPVIGKRCHIVNFQKCTTCFYCLFLMYYFNNFDHLTSWIYLSLHGTYGLLWYLKEQIFPDPNWQKEATVLLYGIAIVGCLGPYWYFAYSINSKRTEASPSLIALCISLHTFGCVLMMASDTQKYFVLKIKKGLISDGWFANCRNTNYLGEMMIYGSYGILTQDWISYLILIYIWTLLFGKNMIQKEESFAKKAGWNDYRKASWMVVPKIWVSRVETSRSGSKKKAQ